MQSHPALSQENHQAQSSQGDQARNCEPRGQAAKEDTGTRAGEHSSRGEGQCTNSAPSSPPSSPPQVGKRPRQQDNEAHHPGAQEQTQGLSQKSSKYEQRHQAGALGPILGLPGLGLVRQPGGRGHRQNQSQQLTRTPQGRRASYQAIK